MARCTHYKSWPGLRRQLEGFLCGALKGRVSYFLTRYHKVHDSYGRAAILLDGRELVCFSWIEAYRQDAGLNALCREDPDGEDPAQRLKPAWDAACTYSELNFLSAALQFRDMPIEAALESEQYIIRILAILDRRAGRRTLARIAAAREYEAYPVWVQRFYKLRLSAEKGERYVHG